MVSTSDYYTDLCKRKPEVARRGLSFGLACESAERMLNLQCNLYAESRVVWSGLYLANVEKAVGITASCVDMVAKSQSELTQLVQRELYRAAKEIHEIEEEEEKEVKGLGYEAGPKK